MWCLFSTSISKNDRKNEENHDFVLFIGVTMATYDIRQEFQTLFFSTIMFCLYSVSKNSKIIQTFMFSEIVRLKMNLIDPSPLRNLPLYNPNLDIFNVNVYTQFG